MRDKDPVGKFPTGSCSAGNSGEVVVGLIFRHDERHPLLGSALTVGGHHTLGLVLAVAAVIFAVAVVDSIRSGL